METKNRTVALELTTGGGTIYSVPANYETEVQSIIISNAAASKRTFTLEWYNSATASDVALAYNVEIEGNAIIQATTPLWLVKGESLKGSANIDSSVVITVYVKEHFIPKQF
jgi:hypothetical protein